MIDNNTMRPLFRFDEDVESKPADLSNIDLLKYEAIVISDYGKGFVSDATIKHIMGEYMGYGQIFLDTKKKDLDRYSGCVIKINQAEALASTSLPYTNVIVTLGEDGATFNGYSQRGMRVNCVDSCGAGDSFLAGLVYGYFQQERTGVLSHTSIEYAMVNAAISVQYHGVYAPNLEELDQGMTDYYEQKFR
jgi:sugar/nucleoside kinase (ribokinase family)